MSKKAKKIEQNDELQSFENNTARMEAFKKMFPYLLYVDYQLTEEESLEIENLNEYKLTEEMIESLKTLSKNIFDKDLQISYNCSACKPLITKAMIKLKKYKKLDDTFKI